jgi:hypothetical protein
MKPIKSILQNVVLDGAPRLLGRDGFVRLANRLGRTANLDLSATREKQLELHPGAALVDNSEIASHLYDLFYSQGDANRVIPSENVAWAASFVPYYRTFTSVVLYNFFRSNYGIRDPILYRYSIFDGRRVVWCNQFLLPADRVICLPDPASSVPGLPEHANVVIEAFHPRIAVPAKQLRYFGIYRDTASGIIAGSHSLTVAPQNLSRLNQPSFRSFGESSSTYFHHSSVASRTPLEIREKTEAGVLGKLSSKDGIDTNAYITREGPGGCPTTIWHDGSAPHYVKPANSRRQVGASYTTFLVPNFRANAPVVLISGSQIGFVPRQITIHLLAEDGARIARKEVAVKTDNATLDLLAEFERQQISGVVNVILEFDRDIGEFSAVPTAYVHLYYRSPNGFADQVHSHSTLGYRDDPFRKPRPYRCRKFGPFIKDERLEFVYSIVNMGPRTTPVHDDTIRMRIFSDCGSEFVFNRKLNPAGITNIWGADLFANLAEGVTNVAVVQFEHETTNFNGSWYAIDKSSRHVAVDHFTGG